MAGVDATETGNKRSQPKFEFTSLGITELVVSSEICKLVTRLTRQGRNKMAVFLLPADS